MTTALVALGIVVVLLFLALLLFAVRRRLIHHPGGTFDCALRPDGKGWIFGVARYNGDEVAWFRVFSYSPRPRMVLSRPDLEVTAKRSPEGTEELALLSGWMIAACRHHDQHLELAMSEDALTGFLAWLESAPPGQRVHVA